MFATAASSHLFFIHSFVRSFIPGLVPAASPRPSGSRGGDGREGTEMGVGGERQRRGCTARGEGGGPGRGDPARGQARRLRRRRAGGGAGALPGGSKLFPAARRPPGCAPLSAPGRRRVPARSPGLGGQEGKFDEAVGEERDALLGDAGNLQPVLQDVEFHRPPALRAPPRLIGGGRAAAPAPCAPGRTERRGRPAPGEDRELGAGRPRGGQRGGPPSREGPRAAGGRAAGGRRARAAALAERRRAAPGAGSSWCSL